MADSDKNNSSSKKTVRSRDSEATQVEILDAAVEEFALHGLANARIETIAANTGVTKAMIYYYFKSKKGLYIAVLERGFNTYMRPLQELSLDSLTPENALEQYVRCLLANLVKNPNWPMIMCYEALQNQGKYYEQINIHSIDEILIAILERGVADNSFRSLEPKMTANDIIGICVFYFLSREGLKHLFPGKRMLGKQMLELHTQQSIELIMAGVLKDTASHMRHN
ncbi:Transcriptional regulator [Hyella patelloides LEGE 07179]|uniref:Transcriptional regulator n=1 Tax=Hyella patelloides LEGE 07179 TaxID=945734 RepID=A0A563VPZ3_9CYAN|nr:TetR/AcrR family transcriptional regulator [Hyella patelloides]VEP13536.1 Transcriptional regulator [Hyella patelloides LEGE 07179]